MKENELKKHAMGIVNQLFDLAEVPVEKRQAINDKSDEYVTEKLRLCVVSQQRELLIAYRTMIEFDVKHEDFEESVEYFLENKESYL